MKDKRWVEFGNGRVRLMPLAFRGHALYCRKCVTGASDGDGVLDRKVGGIVLPQTAADRSMWVEVLAVGPNVGKRLNPDNKDDKAYMKKHGRGPFGVDYEPGDIVLCPDIHATGIVPFSSDSEDFYVEESVPLARWVGGAEEFNRLAAGT